MLSRVVRPSFRSIARLPLATKSFACFNSTSSGSDTPAKIAKIKEIVNNTVKDKDLVSGAPAELAYSDKRVVHIYKEAKYATQSSERNTKYWRIEFDIQPKGNRFVNDLIGFQGSTDYMQAVTLDFNTKEDAVRFAEGQGWDYYVQEPKKRKFKVKQYAFNFLHSKGPLKIIRTK